MHQIDHDDRRALLVKPRHNGHSRLTGGGLVASGHEEEQPPRLEAAEADLLSAVLLSPDLIPEVRSIVSDEDFYFRVNKKVMAAIQALDDKNEPIETTTVFDYLVEHGDSDIAGKLIEFVEREPHGAHAIRYAKKVRDVSLKRSVFYRLNDLKAFTLSGDSTFDEVRDFVIGVVAHTPETKSKPRRVTIGELQKQFPHLPDPVIEGLIRVGEIANIISVSKIGKSWLAYCLLLSVVTGRPWLGRFATKRGRVLLIDNELSRPVLASRLHTVAEAMGITPDEYRDKIDVLSLRGNWRSLSGLSAELSGIDGEYVLILMDAKYRLIEPGTSENDNASETQFYNVADQLAAQTGAALVFIHHSTKGSQSDRRVVDVGAGAGAQSRAADCHLVLREHEQDGAIVLEAAVRSFKPVDPMGLRWEFPLWTPDDSIDVEHLKGRKSASEERQSQKDLEADGKILDACSTWKTRREIRTLTGYGDQRRDRAIARLVEAKLLEVGEEDRPRNKGCEVFRKSINARGTTDEF